MAKENASGAILTESGSSSPPAPRKVEFLSRPVPTSLRVPGREWASLAPTPAALSRAHRFHELLRAMPGPSKRLVFMRPTELESAGVIARAKNRRKCVR